MNVYIALSHWSLLLALQNIKETEQKLEKLPEGKERLIIGEKNKIKMRLTTSSSMATIDAKRQSRHNFNMLRKN